MDVMKFAGYVTQIAEDEFQAGASDELTDQLFEDWKSEGLPKDCASWIRGRLKNVFICANRLPQWPRDVQDWPEFDRKPMVFLGQFVVPEFMLPTGHKSPESWVFVFGAAKGPPTGWQMVTTAVKLFAPDVKGRVASFIKDVDGF